MQSSENYEFEPNFAVICSFLENFGSLIGVNFADLSIEEFKTFLEATDVDVKDLFVKLHIALIKGVFGYCKQSEFEKGLIKFCKDFADGDDKLITKNGYCKLPVTVKLRILKNLCEDQFEYNDRFNKIVNGVLSKEGNIRHQPVGKDRLGRSYWFILDKNSELRLFRGWYNELTRDETWNVVCSKLEDLKELIALLEENENLANDDAVFSGPPILTPLKKISPAELLSVAKKDAENAMYFSSIKSSPLFIKSPKKRLKADIRREERKHKLPHCKVKLARLKKCDFVKWKTEPCIDKIEKNEEDSENLIASKSDKTEKISKTEKVECDTPERTAQKLSEGEIKVEIVTKTEQVPVDETGKTPNNKTQNAKLKAEPCANKIEKNEDDQETLIACKSGKDRKTGKISKKQKIECDASERVAQDVSDSKIKAEIITKTEPGSVNEKGLTKSRRKRIKSESNKTNKPVYVCNASVNDDNKIKSDGLDVNDEKVLEGKVLNEIESMKTNDFIEKHTKHADADNKDLDKLPEESNSAAISINCMGDASSHLKDCVDSEDLTKKQADGNNLVDSAENSQDLKGIDKEKGDNDSDIFNAAIKDLLTLENKTLDHSVVNVCTSENHEGQSKQSDAKTSVKDQEEVDSSENDKEVLDKALKDLIQLEMMTQGSSVDNVCNSHKNGFHDKEAPVKSSLKKNQDSVVTSESEPAKVTLLDSVAKSSKDSKTASDTECNLTVSVSDPKSSESGRGVSNEVELDVNSEPSGRQDSVKDKSSVQEDNVKNKLKEKIKTRLDNSQALMKTVIILEDTKINPITVKFNSMGADKTVSTHRSWTNINSADNANLNNESKEITKRSIPNKISDGQNNAKGFLSKVMNIIQDKDGNGTVKDLKINETNHKEKENPEANDVDDKPDVDKDVNLMVGDEMIRIEVANNSSSDEDEADSVETSKPSNASKESSKVVISTPINVGLNAEKAAISSLYTTSACINFSVSSSINVQSKTLLAPKNQLQGNSQKFLIHHGQTLPLQGSRMKVGSSNSYLFPIYNYGAANSSTGQIQRLLLPAPVPMTVPNRVTLSNTSSSQSVSLTMPTVIIRPASNLASVSPLVSMLSTKNVPLLMSSTAAPVLVGPFNTIPKGSNNTAKLIPGLVSSASQNQGSLISGIRPQVIALPNSSYGKIPNPNVIKIPMPVQPVVSSSKPLFTVAGNKPVANFIYVPSMISTNVSLNSQVTTTSVSSQPNTVKMALKKYLESPIQTPNVENKDLKKDQPTKKITIAIGKDGTHYNAATNEPIVYPDNMRYVIAGPGGKYYDKQTGYQMELPSGHNFQHIPGKVYLASNAKFANGIPKTKKKTKKKKINDDVDTSDEEFEKMLAEESEEEKSEKSEDDNYDYEELSKRVKGAKNLKLPSRRASSESRDDDLEMDIDSDEDSVPIVLGRNAKRVAAKHLSKGSHYKDKVDDKVGEESDDDIGSCRVCDSSVNPAAILLCDKCDEGYHMSCLSPPLSVVPLEDWFCPSCEHNMLIAALKEKLELAKKAFRKAKRSERSICQAAFSINSENIVETERRSCRSRKEVTYSEDKFDKMVIDAVKDLNSEKKRKLSTSSSSNDDESNPEPMKDLKTRSSRNRRSDPKKMSDENNTNETKDKKTNIRPVRTSRNKTKDQDQDTSPSSSTKKSRKKVKLTGIDVESDDSGSDYVQSENSDNESVSSEVSQSSEKKTYLTLSGRATKNVSYK